MPPIKILYFNREVQQKNNLLNSSIEQTKCLNDIWAHEQATAPEQIQDVSSSSLEEQAPPTQVHTTVTTLTSSFE